MDNETFIKHIREALERSDLSQVESKQVEELLKTLLTNHTPEELSRLLLDIIEPMHK